MGYQIGLDIGTSFSVAAVHRAGVVEVAAIGDHGPEVPSLVWVGEHGENIVGHAAERRTSTDPERVARAFKRRFGDATPLFLGGAPISAERLMMILLGALVDDIRRLEGAEPDGIVVTHPANWGDYRTDLLGGALRASGLPLLGLVAEPAAAAIHYEARANLPDEAIVAVYDLGGGTFDVAVLQSTLDGWRQIGRPQGIDHLGGDDFDQALFRHVVELVDGDLDELPDTLENRTAVARLRSDVTKAKEALSFDATVGIPILLPGVSTHVRVARTEFERLIRPALIQTVDVLSQAIDAAGLVHSDLHSVLLVGGSSRIPLVAQLVRSHIEAPIAIDAHPKHAIALGAARRAGELSARRAGPVRPAAPATAPVVAATTVALIDRSAPDVVHQLVPGDTIIGRSVTGSGSLRLLDPTVSGRHASITISEASVTITDLGSTNGTWVNQQRVEVARLQDGDELELGDLSRFVVRVQRT